MEKVFVIGALFFGIFVLVPVVAILSEHQRKMAKLFQENKPKNDRLEGELDDLRAELKGIKDALNILALHSSQAEDVRDRLAEPPPVPVRSR